MFLFIPLCLIVVSVWIKFFFKLLKQAKLNGPLKNEIRIFYKIELLIIAILVITFIPPLFSNDGYKEAQKPFGVWDPNVYLSKAKGLLLPTTETLPQNYVGDVRDYGFGSNFGCFSSGKVLTDAEGVTYCFRFFDSKTAKDFDGTQGNKYEYSFSNAETLVFRANSSDVFVADKLNNIEAGIMRQDFEYAGIKGTILSYVPKHASTSIVRNDKILFWNDSNGLSIEWSTPAPDSRSFEEILNLLHSMRRSDGAKLSNTPEDSALPRLIGEPIKMSDSVNASSSSDSVL